MPRTSTLPVSLEQHRILSVRQMAEALGFSVAHLRRLYRTNKFPKPIMIGARKLGWPASVLVELTAPTSQREAA